MVLFRRAASASACCQHRGAAGAEQARCTNTAALGRILYTEYVYYFQVAGLVLLVAMIGAIVLTLQHRRACKRQSIAVQVARAPKTAVEVVKVPSGGAIIPAAAEGRARS